MQEACHTCVSSAIKIDLCLVGVAVSHKSQSVRRRAGMLVSRQASTMSRRLLHDFDSDAAWHSLRHVTSANSGVPAKWLSVPFCLISRATNRLRTSTRSLSPSLMARHRREIGLRPVLDTHVSSVTSSKALNFSYHAISSERASPASSRKSVAPATSSMFLHHSRSRKHLRVVH